MRVYFFIPFVMMPNHLPPTTAIKINKYRDLSFLIFALLSCHITLVVVFIVVSLSYQLNFVFFVTLFFFFLFLTLSGCETFV